MSERILAVNTGGPGEGNWTERRFFGAPMDCPGCGAPEGYPPAGPCENHGTMEAVAFSPDETSTGEVQ